MRLIDDRCCDAATGPGCCACATAPATPSRPAASSGRRPRWPSTGWRCCAPPEFAAAVLDERRVRPVHDRPADRGRRPAPHVGRARHRSSTAGRAPRSSPTNGCCAARRSTDADDLPAVLDLPLDAPAVGAGVLRSPTYTDAGAEFPMPDLPRRRGPTIDARRRRAPRRRRRRSPSASWSSRGLRQLERSRRGRRASRATSADGDRRARRPARPRRARSTRRPRWPGSPGPARAAAPTVAGAARRRVGSARGGCSPRSATSTDDWPVPPDELGATRVGAALVPLGRVTSRRSAGRCSSRSPTRPTAPPGRSTPATPT